MSEFRTHTERTNLPSRARVETALRGALARRWNQPAEKIDFSRQFHEDGLDSVCAASLSRELGEALGLTVSPTLFWQVPTLSDFAAHLAGEPSRRPAPALPSGATTPRDDEPIAIIGMACRFPEAPDLDAFWRLLRDGRCAIKEVPADRWNVEAYHDTDINAPGKAVSRHGGFLDQVDRFEPQFFGISPREAAAMDPQQRLMLELSWEALEDAGIAPRSLKETRTGVFTGAIWVDYESITLGAGPGALGPHTSSGLHRSILANRISYVLGLQGPSLSVDSACSAALVAVHLACESLRRGESTLALAGAVNLMLSPESTVSVSKFGALSPDGRCFTFDARANGYVRGEGAGVVVLKPLSRAEADGDPIYCVIRGSAVNNDGASNGLTAPSQEAQIALLQSAYERAGVAPERVDYVEAHGTGTRLGDPIEAGALGAVLGRGRPAERPLRIGSVKTNIGHLEGAAGIAGLIKVALSLRHKALPPSVNFSEVSPFIDFADLHLEVQRSLTPWPAEGHLATAGVSSFGFGGTNSHAVVQEWRPSRAQLLMLGAASHDALRSRAERLLAVIDSMPAKAPLDVVCRVAAETSGAGPHRLAVTVRSHDELLRKVEAFLRGKLGPGLSAGNADRAEAKGPVFVFSGQGKQRPRMASALLATAPVFRAAIERCDALVRRHLGWSLTGEILAAPQESRLDDVSVVLPTLVAIEIALVALWDSWGIRPAAVVGYSFGEIAAAHAAGILSLDDAMLVACNEGRLIRRTRGAGGMGLVALSWEEASVVARRHGERLSPAIHGGPDSTVLAGDPEALDEVLAELERQGIFCRRVNMDVAPHSPGALPVCDEFFAAIQGIRPRPARVPFISTLTATELEGPACDARHWARNLAEPVLFSPAIAHLVERGFDTFLEIGPHPLVKHAIESTARERGRKALVLATLHEQSDDHAAMMGALGDLYARGEEPDWEEVLRPDMRRAVAEGEARAALRAALDAPPAQAERAGEPAFLVPISARSASALSAMVDATHDLLADAPADAPFRLRDIARTAAVGREHHEHRLAVVARSRGELVERLAAYRKGEARREIAAAAHEPARRGKVAFVFSGQGSQWLGMGRQLMVEEPVFREAIEACDAAMRPHTDWSLLAVLQATGDVPELDRVDVIQPMLFAFSVALAALWRHLGVEPGAVVGHSMGEVAAAHVAGALSLDDAVAIICTRSKLVRRMSGQGAMGIVDLPMAEVMRWLLGYEDRLSIAASNGPRTTVLSGEPEALDQVLSKISSQGGFCRRIKVDYASHSPQMDPLLPELLAEVAGIQPRNAEIPIFSTVTDATTDGFDMDGVYWARNLREPVLFSSAISRLIEQGYTLFVEVGPHPVLLPAIESSLREAGVDERGAVVASLRRDQPERAALLESLAVLYTRGVPVDWRRQHASPGRVVPLPTTRWQRERFWLEARSAVRISPERRSRRAGAHPLLGARFSSSVDPSVRFWEGALGADAPSYLSDHRVHEQAVFPAAAYVEMALAAAREVFPQGACEIEDLALRQALSLAPGGEPVVQLVLTTEEPGLASFQLSSRSDDTPDAGWTKHASGKLRAMPESSPTVARAAEHLAVIRARCTQEIARDHFYEEHRRRGLEYGKSFQGIQHLFQGRGEAIGHVKVALPSSTYRMHPALLDACLQVVLAASPERLRGGTPVPVRLGAFRLHGRAPEEVWSHARVRPDDGSGVVTADLTIFDADGRVVAEVVGLGLQQLAAAPRDQGAMQDSPFLAFEWHPADDYQKTGRPRAAADEPWLLLANAHPVADAVQSRLEAHGFRVVRAVLRGELPAGAVRVEASSPASFDALLRGALGDSARCQGVIHMAALGMDLGEEASPDALQAAELEICGSALHLVQAMARMPWRDPPRLWLITEAAQPAPGGPAALAVAQAPLWGLGGVIAQEHPELRCTRVDLRYTCADGVAQRLFEDLLSGDREELVALCPDGRYAGRLVRQSPASAAASPAEKGLQTPRFRGDATYLITGGLGGLGLSLARWMVDEGARHLVLVGRSAPSTAAQTAALAALESRGAAVTVALADVSDLQELGRVIAVSDAPARPLRGVVHAAGVLDDGLLEQQDAERLWRVMAPKIAGAWNLHALTRDRSLDFFVLYSSAASMLYTPGQGNYAAANAFLDALAHHRRALGLPALAVNWGPFAEVGLAAAQADLGERLARRGLSSLGPEEGAAILGRLLGAGAPQMGVIPFNVRHWIEFYPRASASTLLSRLVQEARRTGTSSSSSTAMRERLSTLPPAERAEVVERFMREQTAVVVRTDPARIQRHTPLQSLGIDSLMALELRNRLEAGLGMTLPVTLIWTYPSVAALAGHIAASLETPAGATAPEEVSGEDIDSWSELSEDEIRLALSSVNLPNLEETWTS